MKIRKFIVGLFTRLPCSLKLVAKIPIAFILGVLGALLMGLGNLIESLEEQKKHGRRQKRQA